MREIAIIICNPCPWPKFCQDCFGTQIPSGNKGAKADSESRYRDLSVLHSRKEDSQESSRETVPTSEQNNSLLIMCSWKLLAGNLKKKKR